MSSSQHKSPHQARAFRRGLVVVTSAEISPYLRTSDVVGESAYRRECEMGWSHHTSRSESRQRECENRIEWMSYLSYLTVRCPWTCEALILSTETRELTNASTTRHRVVPVHCCWIVPLIDWYPCTVPGDLCLHRLDPVHCYMIMSLLDCYPCTAPVA